MSHISFAAGWTPSLRGNALRACSLIADLERFDIRPDARKDSEKAWTLAELGEVMDKAPLASRALMESVVAVWRLQGFSEQGEDDESWKDHVEAWLVSLNNFETSSWFNLRDSRRTIRSFVTQSRYP